MTKNNVSTDELTFQEEVADEELHSKLGVDDHIYVTKRTFYGLPLLAFFAVLLILVSLFSIIFSTVYLNKDSDRQIGVTRNKYNIVVSHSNSEYGGSIDNFSKYNSADTAYKYNLSVSNSNSANLNYSIELENTNYDFDKIDMSLISYEIVKNGSVIKSGKLKNAEKNDLYNTTISQSSLDEYEIKLWSSDLNKTVNFSFKINVGV